MVCDGCFSNFRKNLNIPKPSIRSHFVGVILVGAKLPHQYCGNVFLANPGPILAYQIGSDEVRILVDIPDPLPSSGNGELAEYLKSVTGPQLPEQLRVIFLLFLLHTFRTLSLLQSMKAKFDPCPTLCFTQVKTTSNQVFLLLETRGT